MKLILHLKAGGVVDLQGVYLNTEALLGKLYFNSIQLFLDLSRLLGGN